MDSPGKIDRLFTTENAPTDAFNFGAHTAEVFDDMLDRSIPQYRELQRMIGELGREYAVPGSRIYDLGCSTGITLCSLHRAIDADMEWIGMDYSAAMLGKCRETLNHCNLQHIDLQLADLNHGVSIDNASVVVLNLTLQFVRPENRDAVIQAVARGLKPGGALIFVEKTRGNDRTFDEQWIRLYHAMKRRNGYSDEEIEKKRASLENVLIPWTLADNLALMERNGLPRTDVFFKWYNFTGMIGVKPEA